MLEELWLRNESPWHSPPSEPIDFLKNTINIRREAIEEIEEKDLRTFLLEQPCKLQKTVWLQPKIMAGKIMNGRMNEEDPHIPEYYHSLYFCSHRFSIIDECGFDTGKIGLTVE